jgi:hypothetical protein
MKHGTGRGVRGFGQITGKRVVNWFSATDRDCARVSLSRE